MRTFVSGMRHAMAALLAVILLGGAALAFERSEATVETASGRHRFAVELAASSAERSQGLQWRRELGAAEGMLFDFGAEQTVAMWMKDTFIPLDMLFVAADGVIVHVIPNTRPLSHDVLATPVPARGVLEVRAGTAARLGIRVGDRIRHSMFKPLP